MPTKHNRLFANLLLAAMLVLSACGLAATPTTPAPPTTPPSTPAPASQLAKAGQPFTLAEDGVAVLGASGSALRFAAVTEDSRCPTDVACVWAGEVTIEVSYETADQQETITLTLPGNTNPAQFEREGTIVRLEAVDPYPSSANPPDSPYTATFVMFSGER